MQVTRLSLRWEEEAWEVRLERARLRPLRFGDQDDEDATAQPHFSLHRLYLSYLNSLLSSFFFLFEHSSSKVALYMATEA